MESGGQELCENYRESGEEVEVVQGKLSLEKCE